MEASRDCPWQKQPHCHPPRNLGLAACRRSQPKQRSMLPVPGGRRIWASFQKIVASRETTSYSPPASMSAPATKAEVQRLKVLWQYDILDTVPEEVFDDLTELAARICEAPIALISLVDEDRQWFKAKVGVTLNET